jgi:PAS domain-containing protein
MSDRDGALNARSSLLSAGQNQALQLARDGASLAALEVLVHTAETISEGSFIASILLLDEDGRHLRHGAAPSLPDAYNRAIDGIEIGPRAGSCGTAAHFGHSVIVTDIDQDPLWADFRALALQHGLRACWSTPFHARDGSVLGTFALYYREPRGPAQYDRTMVKELTATASRVVEHARLSAWLEGVDHPPLLDPEAAELGVFTWDVSADRVVWHNDVPYRMFGIPSSDGPINAHRFVSEFLHADDQQRFAQAVANAVEQGAPFHFEGRIRRRPQGELRWVEFRGRPLQSQSAGDGVKVVGTAADVTARRRPGTPTV